MPEAGVHTERKLKSSGARQQEMNGRYLNGNVVRLNGESQENATANKRADRDREVGSRQANTVPDVLASTEIDLLRANDVLTRGHAVLLDLAQELAGIDLKISADYVAGLEQSLARLRLDLDQAREKEAEAKFQVQQFRLELAKAKKVFEAGLARENKRFADAEEAFHLLQLENAMNKFRSRHRKKERDEYRKAFHQVRYFIFKPRFLKSRKIKLEGRASIIDASGLFDKAWYLEQCPEAAASPIRHYIWEGALEGLDPHPLFDTDWYLLTNRGACHSGENPLIHYLETGWKRGCSPHLWFNVKWYLKRYPDVARAKIEPLQHFLGSGWREGKAPHPDFDIAWYRKKYEDLLDPDVNPLLHFIRKGESLGLQPNKENRRPELRGANRLAWHIKSSQSSPTSERADTDLLEKATVAEELQRHNEELERRTAELETLLRQRFAEVDLLTQRLEEKGESASSCSSIGGALIVCRAGTL